MVRVVIACAEQHDEVELVALRGQPREQRTARRPFAVQPLDLFAERMPAREHMRGAQAEVFLAPLVVDREPLDRDVVDRVCAGW